MLYELRVRYTTCTEDRQSQRLVREMTIIIDPPIITQEIEAVVKKRDIFADNVEVLSSSPVKKYE